jgi:hypothetical protein
MADMIKIALPGRFELDNLRTFLEEQSERPAELEDWTVPGTGDDYFSIAFKDPYNRRLGREIRGHVSERIGEPHEEFVGEGQYTFFQMGESGNAEAIMRLVACRFGGHLWFDSTDTGYWHEPDSSSPTLR